MRELRLRDMKPLAPRARKWQSKIQHRLWPSESMCCSQCCLGPLGRVERKLMRGHPDQRFPVRLLALSQGSDLIGLR